jgi:DNA-binding transcriptional LysR family regulator
VEAIPDLPVDTQGIYAVYPPGPFYAAQGARAFIDFLVHSFAEGPDIW